MTQERAKELLLQMYLIRTFEEQAERSYMAGCNPTQLRICGNKTKTNTMMPRTMGGLLIFLSLSNQKMAKGRYRVLVVCSPYW